MTFATLLFHAVNLGLVVLIWLVQLIIYPLFYEVAAERFVAWHARYVRRVAFFVVPLMTYQLGFAIVNVWRAPNVWRWVLLTLALVTWGVTFLAPVQDHRRLQREGKSAQVIARLIRGN